jgi:hypothetical protein
MQQPDGTRDNLAVQAVALFPILNEIFEHYVLADLTPNARLNQCVEHGLKLHLSTYASIVLTKWESDIENCFSVC